jgi:hypothetical protein
LPSGVDYIVSANVHRRQMTQGQKAMVAAALEPMYAEAARKRMLEGRNQYSPPADLPEGCRYENESREQAAKAVASTYLDLLDL